MTHLDNRDEHVVLNKALCNVRSLQPEGVEGRQAGRRGNDSPPQSAAQPPHGESARRAQLRMPVKFTGLRVGEGETPSLRLHHMSTMEGLCRDKADPVSRLCPGLQTHTRAARFDDTSIA